MRTIEIKENDSAQRLDKFLSKKFRGMPNSLLYKYLRTKRIKLNGKKAQPDTFLNEGDVLTLYISDEFFGESDEKRAFLRIIPNVNVVFEDKNIIVVDKPAGMLCHSDDREGFNTLINHIKAYLYEKGEYDVDKEETFAPSLCNRIDRNTCGLVIAAKNASTLRIVNEKIKNRELDKRYLAVIHGIPEKKNGTIRSYLQKNSDENRVIMRNQKHSSEVKEAVTGYKVIESSGGLSLIEVELITGRTHQIRAQMASIGHPLLGDGKYAVNKDDRKKGYTYQALCSYSLTFKAGKEPTELDYLNGRTFKAKEPDFMKLFR